MPNLGACKLMAKFVLKTTAQTVFGADLTENSLRFSVYNREGNIFNGDLVYDNNFAVWTSLGRLMAHFNLSPAVESYEDSQRVSLLQEANHIFFIENGFLFDFHVITNRKLFVIKNFSYGAALRLGPRGLNGPLIETFEPQPTLESFDLN